MPERYETMPPLSGGPARGPAMPPEEIPAFVRRVQRGEVPTPARRVDAAGERPPQTVFLARLLADACLQQEGLIARVDAIVARLAGDLPMNSPREIERIDLDFPAGCIAECIRAVEDLGRMSNMIHERLAILDRV
jgi:hypothetical protein